MHATPVYPRLARVVLVIALLAGSEVTVKLMAQSAATSPRPASDAGFLKGRVKNQATSDYLANARVHVEGTNISTLTDADGSFLLTVPSGAVTLTVSYAGLDTARETVQVEARQTAVRDFNLTSEIYKLEAVTVTGLREENSLALQAQRYSPNPKTVVATSAYGNASANPGDVIQRISGVAVDFIAGEATFVYIRGMGGDFSTLLVDGETMASGSSISRTYQIQQWGTASLSQVELIKAPTPDQDANAIAGYINLITKRAFDQPGRRISLSLGTNYTDRRLSNTPFKNDPGLDNISLSYSDVFGVFGRKDNFGVRIDASYVRANVFQEQLGSFAFPLASAYNEPLSATPLPQAWGAGDYVSPNRQINLGSSVEYKLNDDSHVFLKLFHNSRTQDQEAFRVTFGKPNATRAEFAPGSTTAFATLLPSPTSTSDPESFASTIKFFNVGGQIGSDHKLFGRTVTLNLRANASYAHNENKVSSRLFAVARGIGFSLDRRTGDPEAPTFRQTAGPDISDPANYTVSTLSNTYPKRPDRLYGARADLTKDFATPVPTYLKVGVKYNYAPRSTLNPQDFYTFVGRDGVPNSGDESMANFSTTQMRLTHMQYGPFPFMQPPFTGRANDPYSSLKNQWVQTAADVYSTYTGSLASNTKLSEEISAAYASGRIDLGKLRILSGLRVERTTVEGSAWVRNTTPAWGGNSVGGTSLDPAVVAANLARAQRSFVGRRKATSEYQNVFPGVHLVYEPAAGLISRASYNKGISRPPLANITPTLTENFENRTVTIGNPNLRPYYADNFELGVEKYFEPLGRIGASLFLKEIKDYFRSFTTTVGPDGIDGNTQYAGFALTRAENVGSARIRGFELDYQQEFTFLPGPFGGLGAFANYTYTSTLGNFGTLATSTKLPFLTPRSLNAGISYVKYGWAVRVMYNWRDKTYESTANGVDIYQRSRRLIDLKMQYRISPRYDVYLDVTNLTNEPNGGRIADPGMYWTHYRVGTMYTAGVNARF